jgi:hypothetical protein
MAQHESKVTTDHDEIRRWIEERKGRPASVQRTGGNGDDAGLLRVDYPGYGEDESLQEISWEDFFDKFEEKNLAFLYQEKTKDGGISRFSKFVKRENSS